MKITTSEIRTLLKCYGSSFADRNIKGADDIRLARDALVRMMDLIDELSLRFEAAIGGQESPAVSETQSQEELVP